MSINGNQEQLSLKCPNNTSVCTYRLAFKHGPEVELLTIYCNCISTILYPFLGSTEDFREARQDRGSKPLKMSRRAEGNRKSGSTGRRLQSKRDLSLSAVSIQYAGGGGGVVRQHRCKRVCVGFLVQLSTSSLIAKREGERQ